MENARENQAGLGKAHTSLGLGSSSGSVNALTTASTAVCSVVVSSMMITGFPLFEQAEPAVQIELIKEHPFSSDLSVHKAPHGHGREFTQTWKWRPEPRLPRTTCTTSFAALPRLSKVPATNISKKSNPVVAVISSQPWRFCC